MTGVGVLSTLMCAITSALLGPKRTDPALARERDLTPQPLFSDHPVHPGVSEIFEAMIVDPVRFGAALEIAEGIKFKRSFGR